MSRGQQQHLVTNTTGREGGRWLWGLISEQLRVHASEFEPRQVKYSAVLTLESELDRIR